MRKKIVVGGLVIFVLIVAYLASTAAHVGSDKLASSSAAKIGLIEVNGAIVGDSSISLINNEVASANQIMAAIRKASKRKDIKAVVLRINSPGGTSGASQEIGIELDRLSSETGKPIITSMGDVCASGGYWIACSSDHIVANGSTLTGSIGVIMELTNLEGLYEKIGISPRVIKSGEFKDIGSASRELTPEEQEILQAIIDDSYEQFLDQVRKGRQDKIDAEELENIADGRIFSGRQALEYGLIDSIGNYYDAISIAEEMAGIPAGAEVEKLTGGGFWDTFALNMRVKDILINDFMQLK